MILDEDEAVQYINDSLDDNTYLPIWAYLCIFTIPAIVTFCTMAFYLEINTLLSGVTALAVMNGSINSIIAWLTIRLDGQSAEALEHLDSIMSAMDKLEQTLEHANKKVDTFTTDLDEARTLFKRVGVELEDMNLEAVSDVVEKLKENKDGLGEILDNLQTVDVKSYIDQAKRIEWKQLLNSAEDIMGFIQGHEEGKKPKLPSPSIGMPKLPTLEPPRQIETVKEQTIDELLNSYDPEEDEEFFEFDDDDEDFFESPPPKPKVAVDLNPTRKQPPKKDLNPSRFG